MIRARGQEGVAATKMRCVKVILFLAAISCTHGSDGDDACDALDGITDYLTTLGAYGICSRNSDCDEIKCENGDGNELELTIFPCRSHAAVRLELSYTDETYLSETFSDEVATIQVSVNNFTFVVVVNVKDRHDALYLQVDVVDRSADGDLVVTVIPYTKIRLHCTDVALIVGLTVGLTGALACCCLGVCILVFSLRRGRRKRNSYKLDELQSPLSPESKDIDDKASSN